MKRFHLYRFYVAALLFYLVFVFWRLPVSAQDTSAVDPCRSRSAELDPERVALLRFSAGSPFESQQAVLREDLQELISAGGFQVVPANSAIASTFPRTCFLWSIDLEFSSRELDMGSKPSFVLQRFGRQVALVSGLNRPAAKYSEFRRALVSALGLDARQAPISLRRPGTRPFDARIEAMRLQALGRLGEAAAVLQETDSWLYRDAALSYRLGLVLTGWGSDLLATSHIPLGSSSGLAESSRAQAASLLLRAKSHLDRAIELEPLSPMAFFHRGKVNELQGRPDLAEKDFRRALELWPAYAAATAAFARSRLARNDLAGLEPAVASSLALADAEDQSIRGSLFEILGEIQLREGKNEAATASLGQAMQLLPAGRRSRCLELLRELEGGRRQP